MRGADPLICIDCPVTIPLAGKAVVRGWIASMAPIAAARVRSARGALPLEFEGRPDVIAAEPAYLSHTGFKGLVDDLFFADGRFSIDCTTSAGTVSVEKTLIPLSPPADKAARLARIRPLLSPELPFVETPFHFNFLTEAVRGTHRIFDSDAVSSFEYAPAVRNLIDRCGDGLVLDCGAGNRPSTFPNVVNLEVVAYPSTDVLAANEQLPFRDDTFSAVISCAVLEHVRDPFAAAREIIRVTKPGGTIHADIPFLQPFHGYPSHYYNMTMEGAKNLFAGSCDIKSEFVPHYGLPVWCLTWFLNSYVAGLPEPTRSHFREMTVGDLLKDASAYLEAPWVRELPETKNRELACTNTIVAVKRGP